MVIDKNEVLFVRAKLKNDYVFNAFKKLGYRIVVPYVGNSIFFRFFRELWFRANLPGKSLWFSKSLRKIRESIVVVYDPIITKDFLEWISEKHRDKRLIFVYENRTDRAILPTSIPGRFEKYSYDNDDCKKWNLGFFQGGYFDNYRIKLNTCPIYDILYVGRDKGRAEIVLELDSAFKKQGLNTYIHICPDRRYIHKRKAFYKSILSYDDYLDLVKKTRAILNIMPEGQKSITMRDFEAVFDSVKEITNNTGIVDWELYDSSRFFVLGVDCILDLPEFLNTPFVPVPEAKLERYKFEESMCRMLAGEC